MKTLPVACAAAVLASALSAPAAIRYTAVTRVQSGTNAAADTVTISAELDGANGRMEFSGAEPSAVPQGAYVLTRDAGQTMYLVNPAEKTYMKWDVTGIMGFARGVMDAAKGIVSFSVTNVVSERTLDEKGPELLGYPTRHAKVRTSYTTETKILAMRRSSKVEREDEIWATPKLRDPALGMWRKQSRVSTGNEQLDKLVQAEMDQVEGFPLKKVSVSTTTPAKGAPEVTRTTLEVTRLAEEAVPAARFELPADYTELSMAPQQPPADAAEAPAATNAPARKPLMKMMRNKIGLGN